MNCCRLAIGYEPHGARTVGGGVGRCKRQVWLLQRNACVTRGQEAIALMIRNDVAGLDDGLGAGADCAHLANYAPES